MPAVSRRQQRYLYANKGEKWVKEHGFDELDRSARKHPSHYRKKNPRTTALTKALAKKDWGSLDSWPFLTPEQRLKLQAKGIKPTSIDAWFGPRAKRRKRKR